MLVDFLGFFADAFDAGAGAEIVVDGAAIVLAELDDGEIAFLNLRESSVPAAFALKRAAGAPPMAW